MIIIQKQLSRIMAMLKQGNLAEKEILTLKEACDYTGLSYSKFYKLSSNNEIPFSKNGKLFFKRKDLDAYMMSNYMPSKEEIRNNVGDCFKKRGANDE